MLGWDIKNILVRNNNESSNPRRRRRRSRSRDYGWLYVHMAFLIQILNLRQSFPDEETLLAFIDILGCFQWPRIHPDSVNTFGFVIRQIFFAAKTMVFGNAVSATSWEPFRRAIAALALSYFGNKCLLKKHKKYLDMVRWVKPPDATPE